MGVVACYVWEGGSNFLYFVPIKAVEGAPQGNWDCGFHIF